ncbi:MAG: GNAT family N-acetyltransferase [Acidimicrobiales bacterium]
MDVHPCALDDARAERLLAALAADYEELYGASDEMARTTAPEFQPPHGLFVVGIEHGVTVAGGGFRRFDHRTCEIKRVWADPALRRRGLASAILAALESAALDAGYERIVLETGPRQPAAAALYDSRGYRRIAPFGPYPDDQGFELQLRPGAGERR